MPSAPDLAPTSTYRLQLHAGFGFAQAAEICGYLADLGISHLYLSPVLQAAPGSMHGYDVVDHTRVSEDLGGAAALRVLAATARTHSLGLIVDVVPNHMAFPTPAHLNQVWWEVLRDGRDAERAHWFDIDWDFVGDRIGLPILGDRLAAVLERGELSTEQTEHGSVLRYFDQVLPLAAGSNGGDIAEVLARQHYRLDGWQDKDAVLNYRRFFDVDTLVAVRVELPDVFEATHRTLLDLHAEGIIDGFRIDHPDGLSDPQGYLEMLRDATGGCWVVVEKILSPGERLPDTWPTAGTTGYDAIRAIQTALAPASGADHAAIWADGLGIDLATVEHRAKREVVHDLFGAEIARLARRADVALPRSDYLVEPERVRRALTELLVHIDRYRAYLRPGVHPGDGTLRVLTRWVELAIDRRPELRDPLLALSDVLTDATARDADTQDLIVRFQQVCGPVMAKGVEDTTFYRFNRFIALNEVGGDPDSLMDATVDALHEWAEQQVSDCPRGMTTLSTHDTKRDEDVRARLLAAGEDIERWRGSWALVRGEADRLGVDGAMAYLVFQTVLGAWPISMERLDGYLQKAVREAKQASTWTDPNAEYEEKVHQLADACIRSTPLAEALDTWVADLAPYERAVNLSAKLIQLTLPGVPDVYQGTELTKHTLVDPDNRRPVDFDHRAARLSAVQRLSACSGLDDEKLWVTSRALRLRRQNPEVFGLSSGYRAIELATPHAIGFERAGAHAAAITLATRRPFELGRTGWQGSVIRLPVGEWVDDLSDRAHVGTVALSDVLSELPVALLRRGTR